MSNTQDGFQDENPRNVRLLLLISLVEWPWPIYYACVLPHLFNNNIHNTPSLPADGAMDNNNRPRRHQVNGDRWHNLSDGLAQLLGVHILMFSSHIYFFFTWAEESGNNFCVPVVIFIEASSVNNLWQKMSGDASSTLIVVATTREGGDVCIDETRAIISHYQTITHLSCYHFQAPPSYWPRIFHLVKPLNPNGSIKRLRTQPHQGCWDVNGFRSLKPKWPSDWGFIPT